MEANDFKSIWKSAVDEDIEPYSDEELNKMVVKSAKRSMRKIQPTGIFQFVLIVVIMFTIVSTMTIINTVELKVLNISGLVVLTVLYFLWKRSSYRMNRYQSDMPIKEWLEYRIKKIERSIKFNAKYDMLIYGLSLLVGTGYYGLSLMLNKVPVNPFVIVATTVGIAIYVLITRRSSNKNYNKTLSELKELYKQFEESH